MRVAARTDPARRRGHSGRCTRTLLLLTLVLPAWGKAQVIRCSDPASGEVLYTDQSCPGGTVVVPQRSAEERQRDALRAQEAQARERNLERAAVQPPVA